MGLSRGVGASWVVLTLFGAVVLLGGGAFWTGPSLAFALPSFSFSEVLSLLGAGLIFAILAAATAIPLALGTAIVLTHHQKQFWSLWCVRMFRALSYLPSVVYGFVFCWFTGPFLQNQFQVSWIHFFRPESWVAQLLAFAVTLVCYPLTIFKNEAISVDTFFRYALTTIAEFSQGSYSAVVIIVSLNFLLVPVFVTLFFRLFSSDRKNRAQDAALALGASEWDGLQLSIGQSMKDELRGVFFFGVGKAFVEGVCIFIVLNYFFLSGNWQEFFWAETFSAFLVKTLLFHSLGWVDYIWLGTFLFSIYWCLGLLYRTLPLSHEEELMR